MNVRYTAEMENIESRLAAMEAKLEDIHRSVEKTRKYFEIVLWVTIAMVVLPIIGLAFAIPTFLNMYATMMNGII